MYRRYLNLADLSLEFAGVISSSIWQDEDGVLQTNPMALAGISLDQINRLNSSLIWKNYKTTHT